MAEKKPTQFSPGFTGIQKFFYIFLRAACLLFTCCVLPLAYYYAIEAKMTADISPPLNWLLGLGAVFWGLLYLCLSQFAFPNTFWGAFVAAIGLFGNGITGASLGDFNLAYGGYSAVWCSIVGQSLFLTACTVIAFIPPLQKKIFDGLPAWYAAFLLICSASLILLAWSLHRPFFSELASEPRLWLKILYVLLFAVQVVFEMQTLKQGSIIGNSAAKQSRTTWEIYEAYMPFTAIGLIFSLVTVLFMWMWQSSPEK